MSERRGEVSGVKLSQGKVEKGVSLKCLSVFLPCCSEWVIKCYVNWQRIKIIPQVHCFARNGNCKQQRVITCLYLNSQDLSLFFFPSLWEGEPVCVCVCVLGCWLGPALSISIDSICGTKKACHSPPLTAEAAVANKAFEKRRLSEKAMLSHLQGF